MLTNSIVMNIITNNNIVLNIMKGKVSVWNLIASQGQWEPDREMTLKDIPE